MSSYHFIACFVNAGIVAGYGVGLLFIPDWFLGKYIYKEDIWDEFVDRENADSKNILRHITIGLGLTWLCWATMGYGFMAYCEDADMKQAFAIANVVAWVCWAGLDNAARCAWGLYSPLANVLNFAFTAGMIAMWGVAISG